MESLLRLGIDGNGYYPTTIHESTSIHRLLVYLASVRRVHRRPLFWLLSNVCFAFSWPINLLFLRSSYQSTFSFESLLCHFLYVVQNLSNAALFKQSIPRDWSYFPAIQFSQSVYRLILSVSSYNYFDILFIDLKWSFTTSTIQSFLTSHPHYQFNNRQLLNMQHFVELSVALQHQLTHTSLIFADSFLRSAMAMFNYWCKPYQLTILLVECPFFLAVSFQKRIFEKLATDLLTSHTPEFYTAIPLSVEHYVTQTGDLMTRIRFMITGGSSIVLGSNIEPLASVSDILRTVNFRIYQQCIPYISLDILLRLRLCIPINEIALWTNVIANAVAAATGRSSKEPSWTIVAQIFLLGQTNVVVMFKGVEPSITSAG